MVRDHLRIFYKNKAIVGKLTSRTLPIISSLALNYCTPAEQPKKQDKLYAWRKPWSEKEGEWYSNFKMFANEKGGSADFIRFMQQDINLRPSAIKKWWKTKNEQYALLDQRYIPERHQLLGNDLATAHFVVHRGGAVRFEGSPHWMKCDEKGDYELPTRFIQGIFVDAIDASNMNIHFEGLANFVGLRKLKILNLQGCRFVDDWCLDTITAEYGGILESLDLSNCSKITDRGLSVLHRFRNLQHLNVSGIATTPAAKLVCLMLEEVNSKLTISGVIHDDSPSTEDQHIHTS